MNGIPVPGKPIRINDDHQTLGGRTGKLLHNMHGNPFYWKCEITGNYFGSPTFYPSGEVWLYTNQFTVMELVRPPLLHFTL